MANILIADNDENVREVLSECAEYEGYTVFKAYDGREAVFLARENDYDMLIIDVELPKLDGFSTVKEIRKTKDVPIIMISARAEEYDKLFGFEVGADDFVTKPLLPKVVMARIAAILRRGKKSDKRIKSDGLEIDIAGRCVSIDGKKSPMTPKVYELLFYLVENAGVAVSREKLLAKVWGYDFYGDDRTVDTHIKMLRLALGKYRDRIVTLRGLGYKIEI